MNFPSGETIPKPTTSQGQLRTLPTLPPEMMKVKEEEKSNQNVRIRLKKKTLVRDATKEEKERKQKHADFVGRRGGQCLGIFLACAQALVLCKYTTAACSGLSSFEMQRYKHCKQQKLAFAKAGGSNGFDKITSVFLLNHQSDWIF